MLFLVGEEGGGKSHTKLRFCVPIHKDLSIADGWFVFEVGVVFVESFDEIRRRNGRS